MKIGATILLCLLCRWCDGQTFDECANDFREKIKKVQTQVNHKQITLHEADSLGLLLNDDLDKCLYGKEMNSFKMTGRSGKIYTNESLKGKVVYVNIWSTNCVPCLAEIPVLNKLYMTYKNNSDFVLISVLLDGEEELDRFLNKGLTKRRLMYEVIPNAKSIIKENFRFVSVYPTHLFLDREGKVFAKFTDGVRVTSNGIDQKDEQDVELRLRKIIDSQLAKEQN